MLLAECVLLAPAGSGAHSLQGLVAGIAHCVQCRPGPLLVDQNLTLVFLVSGQCSRTWLVLFPEGGSCRASSVRAARALASKASLPGRSGHTGAEPDPLAQTLELRGLCGGLA